MFTRKEPRLTKSLDDILGGFAKVRDDLRSFITKGEERIQTNNSKIDALTSENGAISGEVGRAESALININKIMGN